MLNDAAFRMRYTESDPQEATWGGELTLIWHREPGKGGKGAGCELCEIRLMKEGNK